MNCRLTRSFYIAKTTKQSPDKTTFKSLIPPMYWVEYKWTVCTSHVAYRMRSFMWGRDIQGITMPAQQEQTHLTLWDSIPDVCWPTTILMITKGTTSNPYASRGPYNPYFGRATTQRARKAPIQVLEVGSVISSIRTLLERWVDIADGMGSGRLHPPLLVQDMCRRKNG